MKNKIHLFILIVLTMATVWGAASDWEIALPAFKLGAQKDTAKKMSLAQTIEGRYKQEFLMTRDLATNTVPRERLLSAYRIAQEKRILMAQAERAIPIYWQERGPNNVGGRTRGLLIDANDPSGLTVWAAGVSGGLWRTNNIAAASPNWTVINDFFANLAISTIAQDPSNSNILYFGTGEESLNYGDPGRGLGIWRSMNGGVDWARLPTANFTNVYKIVVANDGTVYAASNAGLRRSTNNGATWPAVPQVPGLVQDVEIASNGDVFAARRNVGLYRLQSGTWSLLASPNFPATGFGRVEVTCAPNAAGTLYLGFEDVAFPTPPPNGPCKGVFQSTDGGDTWQTRTVPAAFGDQAWYNFAFSVDPNNSNRVWLGGQGLAVSSDAGATWITITNVHSDHHIVLFRQGNSDEILFGNDGGVYRCTNGSNANPTLANRNLGYNVTQFYASAIHPTSGSNYMLGGTQDNGTPQFNGAGISSTIEAPGTGGDGAFCFIDQDNPNIQVAASQNRFFYTSNNGGASFANVTPGKSATLFITPAGYDNANDILYISDNSDTLGRMTGVGVANTLVLERVAAFGGGQASTITVSPNTANRLFVGTTGGRIVRIEDANQAGFNGTTPTAIGPAQLIGSYISCIAVERNNDNHILVTCSNYGAPHVMETTDGGTNWVDITGDLPDMPVRWAMFHPFDADKVMLATELGVWSTDDLDGANTGWWPTNNFGLANVRVDMLQYRSSDHLVAAATHGRGMYTTDYFRLLNTCVPNLNVTGAVAPGIYMAEDFITSNGTIASGSKVIYHAGEYIKLQPGFRANRGSDFWALIEECGIGPIAQDYQKDKHHSGLLASNSNRNKSKIADDEDSPDLLALRCHPNPTSYRLFVEYDLPADGAYSLYVRDIQGRLIETFASQVTRPAGRYQVELNAAEYGTGIYVLTLQNSQSAVSERFVVAH